MGLSSSKPLQDLTGALNNQGIFHKELSKLDSLVDSILSKNNTFKDNNYNFLNPKVCDKYTMVMESSLSKHLKIHLHELSTNIYFVPKNNDNLKIPNSTTRVTKSELCKLITDHYKKTLKILSLIREIYDFENGGDFSIAGIIYRNLDQVDGMFQVNFCASKQVPLNNSKSDLVDFNELKGLSTFVNDFLTETEATTFIKHLRQLFGNYNKRTIAQLICEDTIVSSKQYREIYEDVRIQCGGEKTYDKHHKKHNLLFRITENKPVISYELCFDKQKIMAPFDRKLRDLFRKFKTDYMKNLEEIYEIIHLLIYYDFKTNSYKLKDLTHNELISIETRVKQVVILLFVQSIINYFKILNYVKNIKHFIKND